VETKFKFHPLSDEQLAGFTLFQNETHHIVFGKTLLGGKSYIILERTTQQTVMKDSLIIPAQDVDLPVCLRIIGSGKSADFLCKIGNQSWQTIAAGVDVSNLSTHVAGGYTGVVIGLYATNRRYCSFKFTKLG
jgi:alpha-N-arabinofuranosidase